MKLTSKMLKKIIQEELGNIMREIDEPVDGEELSPEQLEYMCNVLGDDWACAKLAAEGETPLMTPGDEMSGGGGGQSSGPVGGGDQQTKFLKKMMRKRPR